MGRLILVSRIGRDQDRVTISSASVNRQRRRGRSEQASPRVSGIKKVKVMANENPVEDTEKQRQERHPDGG
jgi:hypothetical protein